MSHRNHRLTKQLVAAIAVVALAVPATSAAYVDHRNPDSQAAAIESKRDALEAKSAESGYVDHRNPDSQAAAIEAKRDALEAKSAESGYVDRRNPDSQAAAIEAKRDALETQRAESGYVDLRSPDAKGVEISPQGQVAQPVQPPETSQATGFDWADAGIGAGSVLGLMLITLSVMFAVIHRRGRGVEGSGGSAATT